MRKHIALFSTLTFLTISLVAAPFASAHFRERGNRVARAIPVTTCNISSSAYLISAQATIGDSGQQRIWIKVRTTTTSTIRVQIDKTTCVETEFGSTNGQWKFISIPILTDPISSGSHYVTVGASRSDLNWSTTWIFNGLSNCVPNIDTIHLDCNGTKPAATRIYASGVSQLFPADNSNPTTTTIAPTTTTTRPPTTTVATTTAPTATSTPTTVATTTTTHPPATTQPPVSTTVPGANNCFANSIGVVNHPINLSTNGTQRIWVLVNTSSEATLSFNIDSVGCTSQTMHSMNNQWMWMPIEQFTPATNSGNHTLRIGSSVSGVKISRVLVFNSSISCTPSGDGTNCPPVQPPATTGPANTTQPTAPTTPPTTHPMDMGNENCTPGIGKLGMMGTCVNRSLIPENGPSIATSQIATTNMPFKIDGTGEPGAFRHKCDFSHMNFDDPILAAGKTGGAHLHTFFGNTGTNAFSNPTTLKNSGNSTCSGGTLNRSAYWVPAMVNASTGRPIRPNDPRNQYEGDLEVYYKNGYQGIGYGDIQTFPNGFEMIGGNLAGATGPTANSHVRYWCENSSNGDRINEGLTIPTCNQGQVLDMFIEFPQCWDGVNLTSTNGRSHVAYGNGGHSSTRPFATDGCPSTHPIGLPVVEMFVRYYVESGNTSNWRLSSDNYTSGAGGYSGHADYIFAWDDSVFPLVKKNCYNAQKDCLYGFGDGREPKFMRTILAWKPSHYLQ